MSGTRKNCSVQGATVKVQSVASWALQFPVSWSRKPSSVTLDFSLSSLAYRLYDLLALKNYKKHFGTNLVEASARELAPVVKKHPTTVARALKELEGVRPEGQPRGHAHTERLSRRGQKSLYRLTSLVFDQAVRVEAAPNQVVDVQGRDLEKVRSSRYCPKCGRKARSTSGVCDRCLKDWAKKTQQAG